VTERPSGSREPAGGRRWPSPGPPDPNGPRHRGGVLPLALERARHRAARTHEDFIERGIGLPGETVELQGGALIVGAAGVTQPHLPGPADTRDHGPVEVASDVLFVLRDKRTKSSDTRFGLGSIQQDNVIGRALAIVRPPSRVGWIR
jgi:hypothetical protein